MMRNLRWWMLVLTMALSLTVRAEDKDKRRLFNMFFMEGDRVTYVLVLQQDRTYTLFTPDGKSITAAYIASDDEIAFPYAGGQRHFKYDFDGKDVKFKPTKKDRPSAGNILGEMPPIGADSKVVYIAVQNWRERGLPVEPNRPAQPEVQTPEPPVVQAPPPPIIQPVIPPTQVTGPSTQPPAAVPTGPITPAQPAPRTITGTYACTDASGKTATLRLREGGTFDYASADGVRAGGTHLYLNGELNLDSGFWRRHFLVSNSGDGLIFARRATDVPKLGDPLGEMLPIQGTVEWVKVKDSTTVSQAGPVNPGSPEPVTPVQIPEVSPAIPVKPPENVVPNPSPGQPATAPTPGATPRELTQLIGTFCHRPNPLVSETWTLGPDGRFAYQDSNGANVKGTATLIADVLRLQAGDVVRQFSVVIEADGSLTFTRAPDDAPRILNDLASMSPSVLKSARYQKQ